MNWLCYRIILALPLEILPVRWWPRRLLARAARYVGEVQAREFYLTTEPKK